MFGRFGLVAILTQRPLLERRKYGFGSFSPSSKAFGLDTGRPHVHPFARCFPSVAERFSAYTSFWTAQTHDLYEGGQIFLSCIVNPKMSLSRYAEWTIVKTFADIVIAPQTGVTADTRGLATREYVQSELKAAEIKAASIVQPGNEQTRVLNVDSLDVGGTASFHGPVFVPNPTGEDQAASEGYVRNLIPNAADLAGGGLSARDGKLSGDLTFNDITVSGTATFRGGVVVPAPRTAGEAVNREYADGLLRTAGRGVELNGSALSVSEVLSHVTAVGVLRSLLVEGPAAFAGPVTVRTPVDAADAVPKRSLDALAARTGGNLQYAVPGEGDTVQISGSRVILNPAGPLAALTIALPEPTHGRLVRVSSTKDIDDLTVGNLHESARVNSLTAGNHVSLVFVEGPDTWFRA